MTAPGIYPIELKSYELDHRGEMPLWVVFRFLQEAAELNAVELGFDTETMLKQALTWMLVRLQLRVGEVPSGRTIVRAESWPSGVESRFAMRDFRLYQEGAAGPFAVATSAWLLIDINRKRPVTVANILKGDHLIHQEHMIADPFPQINPSGRPDFETAFRIRRSDLDMNDHVNNTHYVEWLSEAVPETIWRGWSVVALDIEYKRAVQFGETVNISTYAVDSATYVHRMTGSSGSGDIVLARTVWKKR
ncbi:MAG: hypothetical protein IT282_17255 [Bacteroidetes bacterium]|nr:hypothetical protein [Bacteroidota bacterium]